MPKIQKRRQTLGVVHANRRVTLGGGGGGGGGRADDDASKPAAASSGAGGRNAGADNAASAGSRMRSRKSMLPRMTTSGGVSTNGGADGDNGGRGGEEGVRPSSAASNRRKSTAGGLTDGGGGGGGGGGLRPSTASNRRKSTAGGLTKVANRRKSSRHSVGTVGAPPFAAAPPPSAVAPTLSDPRPVSDRAFLQSTIRKMVGFLDERGYEHPLSVKSLLRGPSGRDFKNIVTFMLRMVDPTFHEFDGADRDHRGGGGRGGNDADRGGCCGAIKFEDEVASAFKTLGYPFPVSKTALVAVGAPHTWPALVAAIGWLMQFVELTEVGDGCEWEIEGDGDADDTLFADPDLDGMEARCETQVDRYMRRSFLSYLHNDHDECADLEAQLLEEFEGDDKRMESLLDKLMAEMDGFEEMIQMAKGEGSELPALEKRREEYANNIDEFYELSRDLQAHKDAQAKKVESQKSELAGMERDISESSTRIVGLKSAVGKQELSMEDVRRMERERVRVEENIARVEKVAEEREKELAAARGDYECEYRKLEGIAEEYNFRAAELEFVPESARHADGEKFLVDLDEERAEDSVNALLGNVDVKGAVLPSLEKWANEYVENTAEGNQTLAELRERIESMERTASRMREDIESSKQRIQTGKEEFAAVKEESENTLAEKQRRVRLQRTKVFTIHDPEATESSIIKMQRQRQEFSIIKQKREEEHVARKKHVGDEIRRAFVAFEQNCEDTARKLEELVVFAEEKKREVCNVELLDS